MAGTPTTGTLEFVINMPAETGESANNTPDPVQPQSESNTKDNPVKGSDKQQSRLALAAGVALNAAKQAGMAAISNLGLSTGNYYAQRRIEQATSATQSITALALSASNPYAFAGTLASMTIAGISEYYQQKKERDIANYQAEQYAKKLGFSSGRK